jgi:hypothetical protein
MKDDLELCSRLQHAGKLFLETFAKALIGDFLDKHAKGKDRNSLPFRAGLSAMSNTVVIHMPQDNTQEDEPNMVLFSLDTDSIADDIWYDPPLPSQTRQNVVTLDLTCNNNL